MLGNRKNNSTRISHINTKSSPKLFDNKAKLDRISVLSIVSCEPVGLSATHANFVLVRLYETSLWQGIVNSAERLVLNIRIATCEPFEVSVLLRRTFCSLVANT